MPRAFLWLGFVAALIAAAPAAAQEFPPLSGRVVDQANLLSPEQEAELSRLSEGIEQASTRQFVVATVPDLQGYAIEDYGYRLGRAWGIGQEQANNGVILLVAPNERRVRIEVGYGLEPIVPDGYASTVVNRTILPAFRSGDMAGGIMAGAAEIAEQLRLPPEAAEARALEQAERSGSRASWLPIAFWLFVIFLILVPIIAGAASGTKHRRGRAPVVLWGPTWTGGGSGGGGWGGGSSGGFGGGGFSGGGGSFGGGGASGGW